METSETLCDVAHLIIHEEGNMQTEYSMSDEFSGGKAFRDVGPVAQRITRLTTDQKIPCSNPGRVEVFFFFSHGFIWNCTTHVTTSEKIPVLDFASVKIPFSLNFNFVLPCIIV